MKNAIEIIEPISHILYCFFFITLKSHIIDLEFLLKANNRLSAVCQCVLFFFLSLFFFVCEHNFVRHKGNCNVLFCA